MSFMDSIKSWLSGNKDTVNNAVDKGGEFLKNKAPQHEDKIDACLLYTSPSPRDRQKSRMPSSA